MSDNTRKKHRRGLIWVDWALLLLVFAIIGVGVWYWNEHRRAAEPTVEIEYVLRISGVNEQFAAENGGWERLIPSGSEVTTANATATLGRVVAVTRHDHREASLRGREIVFVACDGVCDLEITVVGVGVAHKGDGIRVHDIRIAAGSKGDFRIGAFYASDSAIVSVIRREEE